MRDVTEPDRTSLLRELLRMEWEQRRQNGEEPTAQEYFQRFPDREAMIREVAANSETVVRPAGDGVESAALVDSVPVSRGLTGTRSFPADAIADVQTDGAWPKLPGYEITGVLGRGGMGVVYQARDIQLKRLVAIKMIRAGAQADDEEISRFRIEAEAVARLQHTNIVQVYAVGEHAGLPFVVLELVDGGSLHKKLGGNPLPSREAARIAETLARAMQAAHDRGIIHRDLKPANVLLAGDGTPKISDFGLAKRLEDESGQTQSGHVMGTPSYMSPEQATGDTNAIGPATDIYALGAILYELLTGRPPFKTATPVETLRQVLEQDPVPPRQLNPDIDRDCETIALKCLDKQITRRYATSRDLADELARFLGGEPILARPLSAPARVWRFCCRRPLVASLAALSVASMLIGTTVSIFFAVLANRRADVAEKRRVDLISVNAQLSAANATSETRRLAADEAATVAREQSQLALKSLESVIFDIQRKLDNVSGAGDLRRTLLQTALARLQEVSDQFASRGEIDRNTMVALNELGDVFLRIGASSSPLAPAGGEGSGMRGDRTISDGPLLAARKLYQRAFDIAQKLAAVDPNDAEAQRDLSISYKKLGHIQRQSGQLTEALGSYQKTFEIQQKLATADPSDAQAQNDLSVSYNHLGDVQRRSGQVTEALGSYQKSFEITHKLAAADLSDAQAQRGLSFSYKNLGDVQLQSGQMTEALGSYQKGLEIRQKLAAADPSDAQSQRDLSVSYNNLGDVQLQSGQVTEALGSYEKGLEISQKLAAAEPTFALAQNDLSISLEKLADVSVQSGKLDEAREYLDQKLAIDLKLVSLDPQNSKFQRDLSISYEKLGYVQLQSGQVTEALGSYQKCLEIRQKLAAADPSDAQAQRDLALSYEKLGLIELQRGNVKDARNWFEKELEIADERMKLDPSNAEPKRFTSVVYSLLGNVQRQSGQVTEALRSYEKGLEIRQKLAAADPSDAQAQRDLSISYEKLGDVQRQSEQVTEALGSYQKSFEIFQQLAAADPSDAQAQRGLSISYEKLGNVQRQSGQVTEALRSHKKGLEVRQQLAAADPSDAQAQFDLYVSLKDIARAEEAQKRYEQAIEWYENGLKVLLRLKEQNRLALRKQQYVGWVEQRIAYCRQAPIALGDWKSLLEQPAASLPALLEMRGTTFVAEGRTADAVRAVAKLRELGTATAGQLYNAACVYSLCAAASKPADGQDALTPDQSAVRQQHIADALATLREAINAGYKDFAHMQKDPDLAPLRDLPEFKALLPKPSN